jgi:guanylate kinase
MALLKKTGKLVIISGFSGVGKGTVVQQLIGNADHYALSVSMTTRQPRENEKHGVHYYFVKDEVFEDMIEKNGFLEHAGYVGNYYGTPRAFVEENREKGIDVILEIEVQGALQVKRRHPEAIMIFITTPNAREMERRLTNRKTDSYEKITSRMERAVVEAEHMKEYDYVVINDILDDCVRTIEEIIVNEPAGPRYDPKFKERFVQSLKEIIIERKNCTEFGEM